VVELGFWLGLGNIENKWKMGLCVKGMIGHEIESSSHHMEVSFERIYLIH